LRLQRRGALDLFDMKIDEVTGGFKSAAQSKSFNLNALELPNAGAIPYRDFMLIGSTCSKGGTLL
jgi:hypothetical protein